MKSKTKTYLLVIAVLGIWGTVGYRILSSLNPEIPEVKQHDMSINFNPIYNTAIDTFSITTSKRDPFLGTLSVAKKTTIPSKIKNKSKPSPWIPIRYNGIIQSKKSSEQVFIVTMGGKQHLLKTGQKIDSVTLLRGNSKSITLRYKKEQKSFKIEQ